MSTTTDVSLSFVTARQMERSDVKSVKNMLVKSGPMFLDGTRAKLPLKRVCLVTNRGYNTDVIDGWATFSCSAESVSVWTKTDARGREEFKKD
jgi:hypothetical protein